MTTTIQNIGNKTIEIDGYEVEVKAGMYVKLDGASISRELLQGDHFCPFRLGSYAWFVSHGEVSGPACRVEVTGRKINWRNMTVRCQVVLIGDGEPDVRYPAVLFVRSGN